MKKTASRPRQLRAIQTSRHLHVAAHRHTGHVLPRHTTSYPTLLMIVLCVGVLLFHWTQVVSAANQSYTVHASVPGPPPSTAATIDSPADGSQFTSTPITVSGTCPDGTYEGLTRNGFSSGVALCDATGHYQITTDLFPGVNQLITYDYSFTDAQGPASNMISVTYTPPPPPPVSTGNGGSSSGGSTSGAAGSSKTPYNPSSPSAYGIPEPLVLKSHFTFLGFYVGQPATWQINIEGGTGPYAIDAEWGDGKQQLYSQADAGTVALQHTYDRTGGYHGSYVVKITATDAQGDQTFLQLLAIISPQPKSVAATTGQPSNWGGLGHFFSSFNFSHALGYAWSAYGMVLLMLISFWLGERREVLLYGRLRHKRPRHA